MTARPFQNEVRTMSKLSSLPFSLRRGWRDRRGGTLALTAVVMVGVLAFLSLAIDLGMAFTAHTEAQRVADASALAAASAFVDYINENDAIEPAKERAKEYAAQNVIRNVLIDTTTVQDNGLLFDGEELDIEIIPGEEKVRVWIERQGLGVFMARLLGIDALGVKAMAAAEARTGGSGTCLWPMALPDRWDENSLPIDGGDDTNQNDKVDNGEVWVYGDDSGDTYIPWTEGSTDFTGYGTNEVGDLIVMKSGPDSGDDGYMAMVEESGESGFIAPGNFMLWRMPDPETNCEELGSGANFLKQNMTECNPCGIGVGEPYETEPGNSASIKSAIDEVMREEPDVMWDSDKQEVVLVDDPTVVVETHARILTVGLYDPALHSGDGAFQGNSVPLEFNNFAKVFLEGGGQPPNFTLLARFMGRVQGTEGPAQGSLIKYLRLVE